MAKAQSIIGAGVGRVEGAEKVSGQAVYAADVPFPDALWGKILRSPYPHARILNIDTSKARKIAGVKAVVTGKDEPGHYVGKSIRDIPVLCWDKVRYIGDKVAAVAAETLEAAEEAIGLIEVEYEELPAVFDPLEAMKPGAPILHDDASAYDGAPKDIMVKDIPNVCNRVIWKKGDIDQGFREADLVLEHTFRVPLRHQGYIEPQAFLVKIDEDGQVLAWSSSKSPFATRTQLAKAIGLAPAKIRVHAVTVGGDFGGKGGPGDLPIAYFLAKQANRPVRIVATNSEELTFTNPDHYSVITVRTGVEARRSSRGPIRPRHSWQRRLCWNETRTGEHRRRGHGRSLSHRPRLYGSPPSLHEHGPLRILARARRAPGDVRRGIAHGPYR